MVGFGLLSVAWALANPPARSTDEVRHYVKTMGLARGQGDGEPLRFPPGWRPNSKSADLFSRLVGTYRFPADLAPDPRWGCTGEHQAAAAHCLDGPKPRSPVPVELTSFPTQMAKYPPAPYLLLGAVARWARSARTALYAGRLTGAFLAIALLAGAFVVSDRGWARIGVVAASPMAVFWAGMLTTSGIETAAGIAHASAIVAIWRHPGHRGIWAWYAISGVSLALTRPFGPFMVAIYALFGLLLIGRRALTLLRGSATFAIASALSVVAVSAVVGLLWSLLVIPRTGVSVTETLGNLPTSFNRSVSGAPQLMSFFGWGRDGIPAWIVGLAGAVYLVLLVGALWLGSRKERGILVFAVGLVAFVNVWLDASTQVPYDFVFQARLALPLTVFVPILSAAVIGEQRTRLRAVISRHRDYEAALRLAIPLTVVALSSLGWWMSSRHGAVGVAGPWLFLVYGAWSPPMGWTIPIACYGTGIAVLVAACFVNVRSPDPAEGPTDSAAGPNPAPRSRLAPADTEG